MSHTHRKWKDGKFMLMSKATGKCMYMYNIYIVYIHVCDVIIIIMSHVLSTAVVKRVD